MQGSKFDANGNDFVIMQSALKSGDESDLARALCDRHAGVGADGLIIIANDDACDFAWRFYNSDGSHADMCGNGSRAALMYAYSACVCGARAQFRTGAGVIRGEVLDYDAARAQALVKVRLPRPKKVREKFSQNGLSWYFYDTGVPHLVAFLPDLPSADWEMARAMRREHNANVNFAHFDGQALFVRTYERGVEAETLACGTGMGACFVALVQNSADLGVNLAQICGENGANLDEKRTNSSDNAIEILRSGFTEYLEKTSKIRNEISDSVQSIKNLTENLDEISRQNPAEISRANLDANSANLDKISITIRPSSGDKLTYIAQNADIWAQGWVKHSFDFTYFGGLHGKK